MPGTFFTPLEKLGKSRLSWRDVTIFVSLFALLYGGLHVLRQMGGPFTPSQHLEISLSPWALPAYAARSLVRMVIALILSFAFALPYGRLAATNKRWERILIPLLDILQSVPVLGFLSISVTGFMMLFPGSIFGLECASIFAIFSSQAWNIAFSFYQSLKILPKDLNEAALNFQLSPAQRFTKLEVPFAMVGLVWNAMMSFGAGWFFLAASEAITVLNKDYKLPGLGSYMAVAVDRGDGRAVAWAIFVVILLVVLVDQLFWRPMVAWSQKYMSDTSDDAQATSAVLDFLRYSTVINALNESVFEPFSRFVLRCIRQGGQVAERSVFPAWISKGLRWIGTIIIGGVCLYVAGWGIEVARTGITLHEVGYVMYLGFLTALRVLAVVLFSTALWVPVGVRIGFSPRLARIAQPLVQIGNSFPSNLIFPLVTLFFIRFHINLNWGSVLLLFMGTSFYVLFNVVAGTLQIPAELREVAKLFHLRGWMLWRTMILPAIFPFWVTGALTTAGGAWNASIVAEVSGWGTRHLKAAGLGAYITQVTGEGNWPLIILSIGTMCAFVVLLNRFVWQPLYEVAEERYRIQ